MGKREVTEADFRMVQYRDAKIEDFEFGPNGVLVRKDRWEKAVHKIASTMGYESRQGFEIDHLLYSVECLVKQANQAGLTVYAFHELPD